MNVNPYPQGRWTPRAASGPAPAPTVESQEGTNLPHNLYDKYWGVLESSLRAENEALLRLVLAAA